MSGTEPDDRPDYYCPNCDSGLLTFLGVCMNDVCPSHTSMNEPTETVVLKGVSITQRIILLSWAIGLILVPLKMISLVDLTWAEATFPLWGGSLLFVAWGLMFKAVTRG